MSLFDLAEKHGTNKAEYGYTPAYEIMLAPCQRVLEIGIGGPGLSGGPSRHAASLHMWAEFFPYAAIYGMDIRKELLINTDRIQCEWADVMDSASLIYAAEAMGGNFDLIVDDAVHEPEPQINAMLTLLPYLSPTGTYVIEDIANCDPREIASRVPIGHKTKIFQCKLPALFIYRR